MRIVGGEFKGRSLLSPEGRTTRPTSDRARESIFNILHHAGWLNGDAVDEGLVLDLFAGTGALGLEALSRGARHAVFVERDRAAGAVCRDNIEKFGVGDRTVLLNTDALRPAQRPSYIEPRSLVFLDPPYGKDMAALALTAFAEKSWLVPGAVCVVEMAAKQPETIPEGFLQQDERRYGVALVKFLVWPGG